MITLALESLLTDTSRLVIALVSIAGMAHALFFSAFLFVRRKENPALIWLGLFLLAFALRISKTMFSYSFDGIPIEYIQAGVVGKALIGPFLFLYAQALFRGTARLRRFDALHSLFPLAVLAFQPFTDWPQLVLSYKIVMGQLLTYMAMTAWLAARQPDGKKDEAIRNWLYKIVGAIGLIWAGYLYQIMGGIAEWAIGSAWYILILYVVTFLGLSNGIIFRRTGADPNAPTGKSETPDKQEKYATNKVPDHLAQRYMELIERLMQTDSVYLKPGLTLSELAETLSIPQHSISQVINSRAGLNFNDYINRHRVNAAKAMLADEKNRHVKIAAIATDCGFYSLTTFNTAFKKFTGTTPSAYRKQRHEPV